MSAAGSMSTRKWFWNVGGTRWCLWSMPGFVGCRAFGWQVDFRTPRYKRLFSERRYGCGYRAPHHLHLGTLCLRAGALEWGR